ncbi:MAG: hypothetical protein Q7S37_02935 [bacterium]|nr:hypothetical protein [bacterium]
MKAKLTITVDGREMYQAEINLPANDAVELASLPGWAKAEMVCDALAPASEVEKTTLATR